MERLLWKKRHLGAGLSGRRMILLLAEMIKILYSRVGLGREVCRL